MNQQQQQQQFGYSPESALARNGLHNDGWALGHPRRAPQEEETQPPLQRMHHLLRGRYKLAITLALICAAAFASAGFFLPKPQYRSDGLIEIKPNIPDLKDANIVMPLYSQYIESQVNMMLGQRVVLSAMESEEWKPYSKGMGPEGLKDFVEKLEVEYIRGTFLIRVSYTDPDPAKSQAAVGAVVRSYLQHYLEEDTRDLRLKLDYVDGLLQNSSREKKELETQLLDASRVYNMQDLTELQSMRVKDLLDVETQLRNQRLALISAEAALGKANAAVNGATTQPTIKAELTAAQIAKSGDGRMQNYLGQRDAASDDLDRLRQRLGPKHPMTIEAQKHLDELDSRIIAYVNDVNADTSGTLGAAADGTTGRSITPQIVEQYRQNVAFLTDQASIAGKEVAKIGSTWNTIQTVKSKIKDYEDKIADASKTKEQLNVQMTMNGRIRVQSFGDKPVIPTVDNRRKLAICGFLGGAGLPFILFMLIGLSDKRYRYSDETKSFDGGAAGKPPLLGILPNLPDLLTDPSQAAIAAHCVHQIRTLLQVGVRTHDRHVLAVTSAAPGDGKTSLTLALGLSFAASGSRTLLIDCDMVGGSLSRRLGVSAPEGMLEAMGSRNPLEYVRQTDVAELSILPVGSATNMHAASFSPTGLRRLIAEARKTYDIVLIDTGPILGSIEAPSVAATADATILCVSRGQHRPAVERSMAHLVAIGAKIAGIVFNRAEARDFEKSVSRFSQRSIRPSATDYTTRTPGDYRLPGKTDPEPAVGSVFDPVTRAVASNFKAETNSSNGNNGHDPR